MNTFLKIPLQGMLLLALFFIVWGTMPGEAQSQKTRASQKAMTMQRIGQTDITIDYSRPGVKGRKIWGELVPYGMYPGNQSSDGKPYPWRAGANENTTFKTTGDLLVEGNKLPAGTYGIHMIPGEEEWVVIFSNNSSAWGSFSYDEKEDALRVTVKPVKAPHEEWLRYGFEDLTANSATAYLHWETVKVPFKIQLAEGAE